MSKFLIIQTAFIGDVILATPLIEKIHKRYPEAHIDFLLRRGNETLLEGHPYIRNLFVWDKKGGKYKDMRRIISLLKLEEYDYAINLQRFLSSGLFTVFSKAKTKIGFTKNPLSLLFDTKVEHVIGNGLHEVERNIALISDITDNKIQAPVLYPSETDRVKVEPLQNNPYICLSPASVWFTKQLPVEKWIELGKGLPAKYQLLFLGGPSDRLLCSEIIEQLDVDRCKNLCGELSLLQSATLMKNAAMNFVNDSAPLHLASAVNAPVTAFFCSTIPSFGFGPLSEISKICEIRNELSCRPCGLHGKKTCPEKHFKCGKEIALDEVLMGK